MSTNKLRILVLCTGNSCRSQMAEGFFRCYGAGGVEVASAGLEPKGSPHCGSSNERNRDSIFRGIRRIMLSTYLGQSFDYVITVCDNAAANCPVFPGAGTRLHWPFEDPAGATGTEEQIMAAFRRIRDAIGVKVKNWLEQTSAAAVRRNKGQPATSPCASITYCNSFFIKTLRGLRRDLKSA